MAVQIQLQMRKEKPTSKNKRRKMNISSLIGPTSIWKSSGWNCIHVSGVRPDQSASCQDATARVEFISVTASRKLLPAWSRCRSQRGCCSGAKNSNSSGGFSLLLTGFGHNVVKTLPTSAAGPPDQQEAVSCQQQAPLVVSQS